MTPTNLTELIQIFTDFAILTVPVLVSLALLFFVWGLATFILNSGNKEEGKKGRDRIVWGLVALFVILSIGGLLSIIRNTVFGNAGYFYQFPDGAHTQPSTYDPGEFVDILKKPN